MSPYKLCCLCALLLFPLLALGQDTTAVDVDEYVEQLNAQCPIKYGENWSINSFTMVGTSYALVDIQMPSNLSMFLSTLTEDTESVKRMWNKQFKQFGKRWDRFVKLMVENDLRMIVNLYPEGNDESALMTFLPSDLEKFNTSVGTGSSATKTSDESGQ